MSYDDGIAADLKAARHSRNGTHAHVLSIVLIVAGTAGAIWSFVPVENSVLLKPAGRLAYPIVDLGGIVTGTIHDVTLELENPFERTVTINRLEPTCGCTVVEMEFGRELLAGESMECSVQFHAPSRAGRFVSHLVIYYSIGGAIENAEIVELSANIEGKRSD